MDMTDRRVTLNVIGNVALAIDGEPIQGFRSRKALALFIYLACTRVEHNREHLADLLWDATSTRQSLSNLRTVLAMLRPQFGNHIYASTTGLRITNQHEIDVDLWLLDEQYSGMHLLASDKHNLALSSILRRYECAFLSGFAVKNAPRFNQWIAEERIRIHNLLSAIFPQLIDHWCQKGNNCEAIGMANAWLRFDPLEEAAHESMIRLLVRSGNRYAAIAQYERCRQLLRNELDVEPGTRIQALYHSARRAQ